MNRKNGPDIGNVDKKNKRIKIRRAEKKNIDNKLNLKLLNFKSIRILQCYNHFLYQEHFWVDQFWTSFFWVEKN